MQISPAIEFSLLPPQQGFTVFGESDFDQVGRSLSSGDFNGDGVSDFVIGTRRGVVTSDERYGIAYVVFNEAGSQGTNLDLASLEGRGFSITGAVLQDRAGYSVASAGDINGDGIDDIILGAPFAPTGLSSVTDGWKPSGGAYVIFGKDGEDRANIDLGNLGSDGFLIAGGDIKTSAGMSVGGAGDVNGDGLDDLIIGAPYLRSDTGPNYGDVFVVFGKAGTDRDAIVLSDLEDDGFAIVGNQADNAGYEVASAGDFNNDGYDDLLISGIDLYGSVEDPLPSAHVYLIFGQPGATRDTIDKSSLGSDGVELVIPGFATGLPSVSSAGDVNGDGIGDIIVGGIIRDFPLLLGGDGRREELLVVLFGTEEPLPEQIDLTNLGDRGFAIESDPLTGYWTSDLAAAGDVNGDGLDDLVFGHFSTGVTSSRGGAYVIFGKEGASRPNVRLSDLGQDGIFIRGASIGDFAGFCIVRRRH